MLNYKTDIKRNNRESNIELLRIVAMFAILFWHGIHHGLLHNPAFTSFDIKELSFLRYLLIWHVDVFLLITGFWGVKFKWVKAFKFYGYVLLYFVILNVTISLLKCASIDYHAIYYAPYTFFNDSLGWWFVKPYLYLLLISPLIEKIRKISNKEYMMILIPLIVLNVVIGHFLQGGYNNNGFCVEHFVFMYILGMGLKRFKDDMRIKNINSWFIISGVIVNTIILYVLRAIMGYENIDGYNNPLIILNALLLLLLFERIEIQSSFINAVAGSAFAVYLVTDNAFLTRSYIVSITNKIVEIFDANVFVVLLVWFLVCVLIYTGCTLCDIVIRYSLSAFKSCIQKKHA